MVGEVVAGARPTVARASSIAVAQTVPIRGDVDANLEQHLRLIEVAGREQAEVVVFPELSLTGYEIDLASDLAFSPEDGRLAALQDVACAHSMVLVVGAPVRRGTRLYIGAFILHPDRSIQLYTKHHLGAFSAAAAGAEGRVPPAEATVFSPGDCNPLVRLGDQRAAVAVCADTGRPSHPRQAAARGANSYLASMFVIPSDFEKEAAILAAYASEHSMAVALANFGGPSGGLASAGGSAIWSERGELLAQLESTGPGVAVAVDCHSGWRGKAIMLGGVV